MEQATIRWKTIRAKFQANSPTKSKIMQHGRIPPLNLVHSKYPDRVKLVAYIYLFDYLNNVF